MSGIEGLAEVLWKKPSEKNWRLFSAALKKSKAKYYKVFYPKKLNRLDDLRSAYIVVYDSKYAQLFKIPVTARINGRLQGATIYLTGFLNTNKDYKEWVT